MRTNFNRTTEVSAAKPINKLLLLLASSLVCLNAHALTLGNIKVLSNIGEPLRAEIQIPSITPQELKTAKASFAATEVFKRAGFSKNVALLNANFDFVVNKNDRVTLRISGVTPVNEPFLDMVVVAATEKESFSRDYTILLEPSNLLAQAQPTAKKQPVKVAPQRSTAAPTPIRIGSGKPASLQQPTPSIKDSSNQSVININKGDVAYRIAQDIINNYADAGGVNVNQVVRALVAQNPKAFVNNNAHIMLAGAKLRVPSVDQVKRFSKASLPPQVKASAVAKIDVEGVSQASGQIVTESKQPNAQDKDVLTVVAPSEITDQKLTELQQQDKAKADQEISSKVDTTIAEAEAALQAALMDSSIAPDQATSAADKKALEPAATIVEQPAAADDATVTAKDEANQSGIISQIINNIVYIGGFLIAFVLLLLLLVLRRKNKEEDPSPFDDDAFDDDHAIDTDSNDEEIPEGLNLDIGSFLESNAATASAAPAAAVAAEIESEDNADDDSDDDFFIQFASDSDNATATSDDAAAVAVSEATTTQPNTTVAAAAVIPTPVAEDSADESIKLQPQAPLVNVDDLLHEQESASKVIDVDKLNDTEFTETEDGDNQEAGLQLQLDLAKQLSEFGAKEDALSIVKVVLNNSAVSAEIKAQATELLQQLS